MNAPTLSVVTCNYNDEPTLERAIESIVGQSRRPDEYVILDDASTDRSWDVIRSWAARFPWIRAVRNETNLGALGAMRKALGMASGDLFYGSGADDRVLPGAFERAMALAERHPEAAIVCGPMRRVEATGRRLPSVEVGAWKEPCYASPEVFLREYLMSEKPWHSMSGGTFYRRRWLEAVGGYREELQSWCDTFAIRTLGLMHGVAYHPEPMVEVTIDDETLSGAARRDPRIQLDVAARVVWLMRYGPHASVFPEEYVDWWQVASREATIEPHCRQADVALRRFFELARRLDAGTRRHRLLARLIRRRGDRLRERMVRQLRLALEHYPGDVSCYAGSGASPERKK